MTATDQLLVLFPGALGDLLCCWPALAALRARTAVTVFSRTPGLSLLAPAGIDTGSLDRREVADLFASGALAPATHALFGRYTRIESFTGHGDPNVAARLRAATGGATAVHAFRGMAPGEHAGAYYARCLGVAPRPAPLPIADEARRWASAWCAARHLQGEPLVIQPGSGAARKNWRGMATVAARWRAAHGSVIALLGEAERARGDAFSADATLREAPLPRVAALLAHLGRYLGNDSGITHLAGQLGVRTCAVFGDTDARTWRPLGPRVTVVQAEPGPCPACGPDVLCEHRLRAEDVLEVLT